MAASPNAFGCRAFRRIRDSARRRRSGGRARVARVLRPGRGLAPRGVDVRHRGECARGGGVPAAGTPRVGAQSAAHARRRVPQCTALADERGATRVDDQGHPATARGVGAARGDRRAGDPTHGDRIRARDAAGAPHTGRRGAADRHHGGGGGVPRARDRGGRARSCRVAVGAVGSRWSARHNGRRWTDLDHPDSERERGECRSATGNDLECGCGGRRFSANVGRVDC